MSKKHFFLYDFLLPLVGILIAGRFLSDHFDSFIFRSLDSLKPFAFGAWFSHSALRQTLWNDSWLFFALPPALAWLVWVRINLEYDWVNSRRALDRPIYNMFRNCARWIEGGGEVQQVRRAYEHRLAIAEDRVRRLEAELASVAPDAVPGDEAWKD